MECFYIVPYIYTYIEKAPTFKSPANQIGRNKKILIGELKFKIHNMWCGRWELNPSYSQVQTLTTRIHVDM